METNIIKFATNGFKFHKKAIISLILLAIFCSAFFIFEYLEATEKISINCVKNQGFCTIESDKILLGKHKKTIEFKALSDAKLNCIGCSRGICRYDIKLFYLDNVNKLHIDKIYSPTMNKQKLYNFTREFNIKKQDSSINNFAVIDRQRDFDSNKIDLIYALLCLIIIPLLAFTIPKSIAIIADGNSGIFILEKHYLIHKDRKNIKFSDIKQLIIGADAKKFYKISYKNKFNYNIPLFNMEKTDKSIALYNELNALIQNYKTYE